VTYGPGPVRGKPNVMCEREYYRNGVAWRLGDREHMGGEWVKQPEVAKGLEIYGVRKKSVAEDCVC
jgi:hypothetical protein